MPRTASRKPTANGRLNWSDLVEKLRSTRESPPDRREDPEGYAAWFIAQAVAIMPLEEIKDRLMLTGRHCPDPLESDDFKAALEATTSQETRPYRRTYQVTTGDYEHGKVSRVGMNLDVLLEEEVREWRGEAAYYAEHGGGPNAEHRAIWECPGRLVAVLRPGRGIDPEVIRLDD